jgi:hypothetical protein
MTGLVLRGVRELASALSRGERRGRLVHGLYETNESRLLLYRDGTTSLPAP